MVEANSIPGRGEPPGVQTRRVIWLGGTWVGPAGPWGFHPYPSQLVPGTQEVPAQCFLQEQKAGANRGLAGSSLNSFCSPGGSPSPHGGEVLLCEPGHETQNCPFIWAPLGAHTVKSLPAMQETPVPPLGLEYLPEKRMATHCSILAWRIPRTDHGVAKRWTCLRSYHFHFLCLFIWEGGKEA